MCTPLIGLAIGAIGVGAQAFAASRQVEASNQAAEYNAQVQERNAQIAEMQAVSVEQQGEVDKQNLDKETAKLKARQRVAFAGSGVQVDSGSAFDVLQDTTEQSTLDSLTIMNNAATQAWGHRTQAGGATAQAELNRASKGSSSAAFGTTLLTGGSQLAGKYFSSRS